MTLSLRTTSTRVLAGFAAALAAFLLAALAAGAPSAHAAFTSASINDKTATINGDDATDAINVTVVNGVLSHGVTGGDFKSAIDWDTTADGEQTVPADGTFTVVVNGGGGDDNIAVTAQAKEIAKATLNGDGGNDLLTGAPTGDDLRGGDGNDRLVGFTGEDDMEGGAGNDTLVWNNGDGTDVMDGDAGNDGVEVNGAPTAGDVFTIEPNGSRVRFQRTNLGQFSLDVSAERLEVNGLGGDDLVTATGALAPLTLLTLNGGAGIDALTGADGADLIQGGDDNDRLSGGGGDDRIVGDRGADAMDGGAGADTLVWNNGDGSDTMDGGDGRDTVEVNGSVTQGDVFTVVPNGARVKFDRVNLVPFSLNVGTAEAMTVNGLGGDDTVTVGDGLGSFAVTASGGSGNDTLTGGNGPEALLGGDGNDTITGGGGSDFVSGDEGDDTIAVRDLLSDLVACGGGADQVTADAAGVDVGMEGCETVDRTAPPVVAPPPSPVAPPAPSTDAVTQPVGIRAGTIRVRNRVARIRVSCPISAAAGCRATLVLTTARTVKVGRLRVVLELSRTRVALAAGRSKTVSLKLPRGLEQLAGRSRRLAVRATAVTGSAGKLASSSRHLTLSLASR